MLLFQQISEKIRLTKNVQRVKKKTQIPIVKIKNIFWCIGAYLFNYKIPQFSPKKIWIFRGGFFTSEGEGGGGLFITPAGTFSDVLQYSSPLPNLHRTIGVDSKNYNSY